MTIKWMEHPKHGRYPCTSSDVDLYKKAGWTEVQPKAEPEAVPVEEEATDFDPNAIVMSADEDLVVEEPKPKKSKKVK